MALSRKEKNAIRKNIMAKVAELDDSPDLSRKEKNTIRKEIMALVAKLDEKIDIIEKGGGKVENEKLKKLIAGDYDKLAPHDYLAILREIYGEINDIEPLKEPAIRYIKDKKAKEDLIAESAVDAILGEENGERSEEKEPETVAEV